MRPVGGEEVVEREQFVAVASQAGGGLGVLVVVALEPVAERTAAPPTSGTAPGNPSGCAPGHPHVHLPERGENLALRKVTVANHLLPSVGQLLLNERRQILLELSRDRRFDQSPCASPKMVRQGVPTPCWHRQRNHSIVAHVRCALRAETVFPNSISAKTRRTIQVI